MSKSLPAEISWRKDKVGFEPPQKQWMEDRRVKEMIQEGRRVLVDEKILNSAILDRPIIAKASHESDNDDWRYLAAGSWLK